MPKRGAGPLLTTPHVEEQIGIISHPLRFRRRNKPSSNVVISMKDLTTSNIMQQCRVVASVGSGPPMNQDGWQLVSYMFNQ